MAYHYFDDVWRTKVFHCRSCGWSGTYEQAQKGYYEGFVDVMCPRCDVTGLGPSLSSISYPTLDEMRANVDKPGVREELDRIESAKRDSDNK